jgi:nitrite reductase/ring-hydroxylating ferredoxin subunit
MSRFPFPSAPVGWFVVAPSSELPPQRVLPLRYFGKDFVLFRSALGTAHLLDAYCPHLGAHLGHGGVVAGESIRCPFHGFCFDGAGNSTHIPLSPRRAPSPTIPSYPICERNGLIAVYHHPAHEAPETEVPVVPECVSDAWTPFDLRRWKIRTHVQEMAENGFDMLHFRHLHKLHELPEPQISFEGPHFRLHVRTLMDTPFGPVDGTLDIQSLGLGIGLVRFSGLIDTLLVTAITPIDDEYVDARFFFKVKKLPNEAATQMVGTGFVDELSRQVDQDITIWENKIYVEEPVYGQHDGPIAAFRSWASQFYPTKVSPASGRKPTRPTTFDEVEPAVR